MISILMTSKNHHKVLGASLEFPLKIVLLIFFVIFLKFVSESALIYRNASYWLYNCAFSIPN